MAFSSGNNSGGPMADINVTPLVDVMLVLLIIFMVTAPILSYPIDIDLPQKSITPPPEVKNPPEPIKLRIDAAGQVVWNNSPVPLSALRNMMDAEVERDPGLQLVLRSDADGDYQGFVGALSSAREAGVRGIATDH